MAAYRIWRRVATVAFAAERCPAIERDRLLCLYTGAGRIGVSFEAAQEEAMTNKAAAAAEAASAVMSTRAEGSMDHAKAAAAAEAASALMSTRAEGSMDHAKAAAQRRP